MTQTAFDELGALDDPRPAYAALARWLADMPPDIPPLRRREAEHLFRRLGITFAVYGEGGDPERLIPFDLIPRIVSAGEWAHLEAGLIQRVAALNAFLADIYHGQEILKAGVIPADLVLQNEAFRPEMMGLDPPGGVYIHIAGIDMIRVGAEDWYVLEDNARTPSGVSYMLENREVMIRLFPELFATHQVAPVEHYPERLYGALASLTPPRLAGKAELAVLTPGIFNAAYYEHSFLADQMGVELVEGSDLFVSENRLYKRTTNGAQRVDILYRRVDDDFLDPLTFRPDSALGVPGIMNAYRAGNLTIANAVGTGIADDKAVYAHVPDMIRFYLGQEPILANVPTWSCGKADDLAYVLDHLDDLVVKEVHGSGGYGMLVGPQADAAMREAYAKRIRAEPAGFIAQPTLALSTCPTFVDAGIAPRHVDLRPFILTGANGSQVLPGGLTRVALKEGSLVVNSSQGGGTKDTWVLEADPSC